jgi:hypothetical protein
MTQPNSFGEQESDILEKWSDSAIAASHAARHRRRLIRRLEKTRSTVMNKMLDQINHDKAMGRSGKGISTAAARHWQKANQLTGHINSLRGQKATADRPLISRLRKKLRSLF